MVYRNPERTKVGLTSDELLIVFDGLSNKAFRDDAKMTAHNAIRNAALDMLDPNKAAESSAPHWFPNSTATVARHGMEWYLKKLSNDTPILDRDSILSAIDQVKAVEVEIAPPLVPVIGCGR